MQLSHEDRLKLHEINPEAYPYPHFYRTDELLAADPDAKRETLFMARRDGINAIYAGCHASLYGEPGGGKTLLAKYITAQALNDGHRVIHIDIDDNRPEIIAHDIKNFGANYVDQLYKWELAQPPSKPLLDALWGDVLDRAPNLVIIDSMASLEALVGSDANISADFVANIFQPYIKTLTSRGTTVLTIDHVSVKNKETRGAMGSTQKLAKTDLAIHVVVPDGGGLTPGELGSVALYIDKDRHGVTKSTAQMREYAKGHMRAFWGNFVIPRTGLTEAHIQGPNPDATNKITNW